MSVHRARHLAALSLAAAGAGALACLPFRHHPLGAAGFALFEAGMVGGAADWFAVTALFRHPLGQRWVPHTSIIARNRDRIIDNLVRLVDERLLNRDSLQQALLTVPLLERLLESLDRDPLLDSLTGFLLTQAQQQLDQLDDRRLAALLEPALIRELESRNGQSLWHGLRTSLLADPRLEELVAGALGAAGSLAHSESARTAVHGMLEQLVEGMIGGNPLLGMARGFLNLDRMTELVIQGLNERLQRAARDAQDPLRVSLREALAADSPAPLVSGGMERVRLGLLESTDSLVQAVAPGLRKGLLEWLNQPERHAQLRALLARELERIENDARLREQLELWLRTRLLGLAERHHHRIGELVRANLSPLSGQDLADELEERVGSDLQWIRVNGAVVGGLVGLGLHLLLSIPGFSS